MNILLGVCLAIFIFYSWVKSHVKKPSRELFSDSFIRGTHPIDEFRVVPPSAFNWDMVKTGSEFCFADGRLLVVSLVRNCEKSIPYMIRKIRVLASVFREVRVCLFENNSADGTRKKLLPYALGEKKIGAENAQLILINPFTMAENEEVCQSSLERFINGVKAGLITGASGQRIGRMTYLRNRVLEYVYQHQSEYTTLLMTDMDIIGRWFATGIRETVGYLRSNPEMGFVTFRGYYNNGGFFDPFSLKERHFLNDHPLANLLLCLKGLFAVPSGKGLYPVISSHSGGIFANLPLPPSLEYKLEDIIRIPNVYTLNVCEHVSFMEGMKNNFVNTNMTFLIQDFV
jgi:hypothetical protein